MTPKEVLKFYRSTYNFHKQTGMASNTLSNWIKAGFVPQAQQCRLEMLTKGALKSDLGAIT